MSSDVRGCLQMIELDMLPYLSLCKCMKTAVDACVMYLVGFFIVVNIMHVIFLIRRL